MGKKIKNRFFHIGKNTRHDNQRTSITGFPNSNLDTYEKSTGNFKSRRKYDDTGKASKDLDVGHYDHNKIDHMHYYSENGRSGEIPLSKKDKVELEKCKKKRKWWLDD